MGGTGCFRGCLGWLAFGPLGFVTLALVPVGVGAGVRGVGGRVMIGNAYVVEDDEEDCLLTKRDGTRNRRMGGVAGKVGGWL